VPIEIEYTEKFEKWWLTLNVHQQESVASVIELLAIQSTDLGYPYLAKSDINLRALGVKGLLDERDILELRIIHEGTPFRVYLLKRVGHQIYTLHGGSPKPSNEAYTGPRPTLLERIIPIEEE
jgi:hypothetical protein